jgi:hypothetical protein
MSSSSEGQETEEDEKEEELPPLIRIEDEKGESPPLEKGEEASVGPAAWEEIEVRWPEESSGWESVEQGIARRHRRGRQAFRNRRWDVNQGIYVEPRDVSPISPWAELPKKGTEEWTSFGNTNWREEAKRLIEAFKWWKKCGGQFWKDKEERREWRLKHLEIPFISCPGRGDPYDSIKDMPWNQEAIQEMIRVNPSFKEPEWAEKLQDWQDPESASARKEERRRRWAEERRAIEEAQLQAYQRRQREEHAQALIQNAAESGTMD